MLEEGNSTASWLLDHAGDMQVYIQCQADTTAAESRMSKESMQGPVASHPPSPTISCDWQVQVACVGLQWHVPSTGMSHASPAQAAPASQMSKAVSHSGTTDRRGRSLIPCAEASCWQGRPVRPQEFRAQVAKFAAYYQRHRRRLPFLVWRDASVPHFNTATGARCALVQKCAQVHLCA